MRQIEFRGKGVRTGEWRYGAFVPYSKHMSYIYGDYVDKDEVWQVSTDTVGQFTGLLDKNGKKIFEGDILDCTDRITFVHWNEFCGTWDCKFIRYKSTLCSNGITPVEWKYRAEIIGNIYEIERLEESK